MPQPKLHVRKTSLYIAATVQGDKPSISNSPESTNAPLPCTICTRLSTTIPCCTARADPSSCPTCLAFDTALAAQAPDAGTTRQIKQDRVESLKFATKDLEAEKDRLKATLEEKKRVLQQKVKQLDGMVSRNDFRKRMKKVRKAGEAKKLPGEK